VGRPESPLDPDAGTVQRFAHQLRELREKAGKPTYRAMAKKAGYTGSTLSEAAAGGRLPSLPVVLAYVAACDGDVVEWEARWHAAVREEQEQPRVDDGSPAPYVGLGRFQPGDRHRFFGRDRLTADLVRLGGAHRLVGLVGMSGSGKSSLLRAGLVPAVQEGSAPVGRPAALRILTPGERPATTHASVLAAAEGAGDTWVLVDQFEEIFTLCQDPRERAQFIDGLLTALEAGSRLRVVLAIRADFYGRCGEHQNFAQALQKATLLVTPMSREELREAVVKPAATRGLVVERALAARVVEEVADEPGGLPLLSHALLETWRRRRGKTLTLQGYEAAGGLHGAIARTAEDVYTRLEPAQADQARRLLLRLITPGEGTPDTRRPAPRSEINPTGNTDTETVLEQLARARLITLDDDTVDLAHEALITAWPRLKEWISSDRARLRLHRRLAQDTAIWEELGRDPGMLYRGNRLSMVEEQLNAAEYRENLTKAELAFLTASTNAREREQRAAVRGVQRLRRLRAAVSLVMVLVVVAGAMAWQQSESREWERLRAEARRVAALADSLRSTDPVMAMRLSIASWSLAHLPESRSALMSAAVQKQVDVFTSPETDPSAVRYLSGDGRTLINVGTQEVITWDVNTHKRTASFRGLGRDLPHAGVVSPDLRKLTLVNDDGRVAFWDLRAGRREGRYLRADDGGELSPSGRTLLLYHTSETGTVIQLKDVRTRRTLLERRMRHVLPLLGADGRPQEAVGVSFADTLRADRQRRQKYFPLADAQVSANDRYLALCVPGVRLELWDISQQRRLPSKWTPKASAVNCFQEGFHFTPDNRHLFLRNETGVHIWDILSGRKTMTLEHETLTQTEFSPDGKFIVAADADEILLWRTEDPTMPIFRHAHSDSIIDELRLNMDERRIRYFAGMSHTVVRSLSLDGIVDSRWENRPTVRAAFSPGGSILAIAHQNAETGRAYIRLLDGRNSRALASPQSAPCSSPPPGQGFPFPCSVHMTFRHDGGVLAYGVSDATYSASPERLVLWDVSDHRTRALLTVTRPPSERAEQAVNGVTFHPDKGSLIVSRIPSREQLEFWDMNRGSLIRTIPDAGGEILALKPGGHVLVTNHGQFIDLHNGHIRRQALTSGSTTALVYSPDGRYLAAGDESGQVTIWDSEARKRLGILPAPAAHVGKDRYVTALAFSPDARTLATAGKDGTLRLWDTAANRVLGSPLPTPDTALLALAFSPNGKTLRTTSAHVPLQQHNIDTAQIATVVCKRAQSGLTVHEWQTYIRGIPYRSTC
jgi:WD40 repeat protein